MRKRILAVVLMMVLCFSTVVSMTGCKKNTETTKVEIETETKTDNEDSSKETYKFDGELVTEIDNVYECKLAMGEDLAMMIYLRINSDGDFTFSRNTDFSSTEKGAGRVYRKADGSYALLYHVINGEVVTLGDYIAQFQFVNEEIQFTSVFWFGATTPKYEGEDGTITYPTFTVSKEEIVKEIEKDAIDSQKKIEEKKEEKTEENVSAESTTIKYGNYGGTYTTTAMGSQLKYAFTLKLNQNNSYSYSVQFKMSGQTYSESESGTYKVNGSNLTLTCSDGTTMSGSISSSGTISLTRKVSSFAFSPATIQFKYNYTPSVGSNTGSSTENKPSTDAGNKPSTDTENKPEDVPTYVDNLVSGKYVADISWSAMSAMMTPVVELDAENDTFKVYNKTAPETSKGTGAITFAEGSYTMTYADGNTTTFTYDEETGEITFTSKLWYGKASFNSAGEDGVFVPYKGTLLAE